MLLRVSLLFFCIFRIREIEDMESLSKNNTNNASFLDDMIAIRDELWANDDIIPDILPGELSETFALLDPDLAALHKDMKTAAMQLSHAKKTGQMTNIVKWRFESAESAYQTRLLEVRQNKLAHRAQEILEEAIIKRLEHEDAMQNKMNEQFASIREKRLKERKRKESNSGSWLFYFMLGVWLSNIHTQRMNHDMNMRSARRDFLNTKVMV